MTRGTWSRRDARELRAMYERLRRFAGAVGPWEVEPEDLLQEALVRVLQGGSLSRLDYPEAYLRRTIVNLSHNYIRRRHNTDRVHAAIAETTGGEGEPSYPSDLADLLSLDPVARAILYLHDVERYSFPEVSDALGVPVGTCRQIASRSREQLRHQIQQEVQK
ncbi:MAG: sigma-70 family RNA polymerase sigma factor [Actinomycetota bacterium]|nr:sigma-70 family RNA polymerase sigma factor [Actinomycetota bacterium]